MHTVEIKSTENGPNLVYLDGKVFTALCRCGGSSNKPFCDGTHAKIAFHAKAADLKDLTEHSKVEAYLRERKLIIVILQLMNLSLTRIPLFFCTRPRPNALCPCLKKSRITASSAL